MDEEWLEVARRAREIPGAPRWVSPYPDVGALLRARALAQPDRELLVFRDPGSHGSASRASHSRAASSRDEAGREQEPETRRSWTYAACERMARYTAQWLSGAGVEPGDRVAVLTANLDYTILLYLGVWTLGACAVPLNAAESEPRKRYILEHSRARLLFASDAFLGEARRLGAQLGIRCVPVRPPDPPAAESYPAVLEPLAEDSAEPVRSPSGPAEVPAQGAAAGAQSPALLVYTSGTTGDPKGVLLDQSNLLADADAVATWQAWGETTRMLCVLPIHHVNGIVVSHLTPLYAGGSTVLLPGFSVRHFWLCIAQEHITTTSLVPTLLQYLLERQEPGDGPAGLQSVLCGAGPLRVDTALAFEEAFGVPLIHGYGLSETTAYNCQLPVGLSREERCAWLSHSGFASIGCPLPHHEMSIRDANGHAQPPGVRGEICVRGGTVSRGYARAPEATRAAFRDGWFHSGDEGFFVRDAGGRRYYFITGRLKELIIRGGVNYAPLEIDAVLSRHPAVAFGLAIPFESHYYGEEVAAYVVRHPGAEVDEAELIAFCREHLDFARSPKVIVFGERVPYTTTGKPKRIELARELAESLARYRSVQFRPGSPFPSS